ncbi:MAG: hypothetical protein V1929_09565 [bacterium]
MASIITCRFLLVVLEIVLVLEESLFGHFLCLFVPLRGQSV